MEMFLSSATLCRISRLNKQTNKETKNKKRKTKQKQKTKKNEKKRKEKKNKTSLDISDQINSGRSIDMSDNSQLYFHITLLELFLLTSQRDFYLLQIA